MTKPRCFLVYAKAPPGLLPAEANRLLNEYVMDPSRGLAVFHDHFIGAPGGTVVFYVQDAIQREALRIPGQLEGWEVEVRPLVFAHSPSAFDEQTTFTLRSYRGKDWDLLRQERRPRFGDARREAETAREDD